MTYQLQANSGSQGRRGFARSSDLLLAGLILAIVALMILPLPIVLLDSLLAVNIALGVILVLMAIYVSSPLQFSVFPSVLLISTLFRLALSVATTRMILLNGDAGSIVETFGTLVAGGNIVVGMVVFLIITVVQFLVIAKGAERVAEVSARFTLDAMPGKQMSIDSDLRSGLIDKVEARRKREEVELESQLHGSMDGAMKFVKGDAIAGIVIILVNLIGGLTIGVSQLGMSMGDAMSVYSILTIGDGMVAQIPALFAAMSAGLIVTRVSAENDSDNLGNAMQKQFASTPRVLVIAGVSSLVFALVPGFPTFTFAVLGLSLIALGAMLVPALRRKVQLATQPTFDSILHTKRAEQSHLQDNGESVAIQHTVPLLLELPTDFMRTDHDGVVRQMVNKVVDQYQSRIGLQLPKVDIYWNAERGKQWQLHAFEVPIVSGEIAAQQPLEQLAAELDAGLRQNGYLFVGIQEVTSLMSTTGNTYPDIVKEVLRLIPIQNMSVILRNLVQEDMSIRNMRCILEALIGAAEFEKDSSNLTEIARISLGRETCHRFAKDGTLSALTFAPQLEEQLETALRASAGNKQLALDPMLAEQLRTQLKADIEQYKPAVIVTRVGLRKHCRTMLGDVNPCPPVLSYSELLPTLQLQVVHKLALKPTSNNVRLHAKAS